MMTVAVITRESNTDNQAQVTTINKRLWLVAFFRLFNQTMAKK